MTTRKRLEGKENCKTWEINDLQKITTLKEKELKKIRAKRKPTESQKFELEEEQQEKRDTHNLAVTKS